MYAQAREIGCRRLNGNTRRCERRYRNLLTIPEYCCIRGESRAAELNVWAKWQESTNGKRIWRNQSGDTGSEAGLYREQSRCRNAASRSRIAHCDLNIG